MPEILFRILSYAHFYVGHLSWGNAVKYFILFHTSDTALWVTGALANHSEAAEEAEHTFSTWDLAMILWDVTNTARRLFAPPSWTSSLLLEQSFSDQTLFSFRVWMWAREDSTAAGKSCVYLCSMSTDRNGGGWTFWFVDHCEYKIWLRGGTGLEGFGDSSIQMFWSPTEFSSGKK